MFNKFLLAAMLIVGLTAGAIAQQPIKSGPPQRYTDTRTGKTFEYVCNGSICYWQEVAPQMAYPLVIEPAAATIPVLQLFQVPAGSVAVQVVDRGTGKYVRYQNSTSQSWVWFPNPTPAQTYPQYPAPYPSQWTPYSPGPFGPGATPGGVVVDPNSPLGAKPGVTVAPKSDGGPPKPETAK